MEPLIDWMQKDSKKLFHPKIKLNVSEFGFN